MADDLKGLRTAVDLVRQGELFGDGAEDLGDDLDALPGPLDKIRRPGRPKGSRNRSTDQVVEILKRTGRDPLLVLRDWATAEVTDLARLLGCKAVEAARLQVMAAKELAPYMHSKKPVAVEANGGDFVMMIGSFQGGQGGQGAAFTLPSESVDYQVLSQSGPLQVEQEEVEQVLQAEEEQELSNLGPLISDQAGEVPP